MSGGGWKLDLADNDKVPRLEDQWTHAIVDALKCSFTNGERDLCMPVSQLTERDKFALAVHAGVPLDHTVTDDGGTRFRMRTVPCSIYDIGDGYGVAWNQDGVLHKAEIRRRAP